VERDARVLRVGAPQLDAEDVTSYGYCTAEDTPTGNGDEVLPYGIQMVRAWQKDCIRASCECSATCLLARNVRTPLKPLLVTLSFCASCHVDCPTPPV